MTDKQISDLEAELETRLASKEHMATGKFKSHDLNTGGDDTANSIRRNDEQIEKLRKAIADLRGQRSP